MRFWQVIFYDLTHLLYLSLNNSLHFDGTLKLILNLKGSPKNKMLCNFITIYVIRRNTIKIEEIIIIISKHINPVV